MQSVRCEHCGQMISGTDEEQLVRNLRDHNRQMHDIETPEHEAREKVRETSRERGSRR
jgi:predicted small metal-binding protein